jgi:hypothetical protein
MALPASSSFTIVMIVLAVVCTPTNDAGDHALWERLDVPGPHPAAGGRAAVFDAELRAPFRIPMHARKAPRDDESRRRVTRSSRTDSSRDGVRRRWRRALAEADTWICFCARDA